MNILAEIDAPAIMNLIERRVKCNERLAEHPTVQVEAKDGEYFVGFLGVLNGMFGVTEDGYGHIVAIYHENGSVSFCRTEEWVKPQ
ncbi:MAG: hypothetical protein H6636_06940 [Anaerolineales bacterium]|nr:hypothetical protein [Anaerolineales bacterium]